MDFARAQKPVRQLRKLLKALPADPPPAQIHRLRTNARRVEAAAATLPPTTQLESRRLLKALKTLRRAAGPVREMDVLAVDLERLRKSSDRAPFDRLAEHLSELRHKNAARLLEVLDRHRGPVRRRLKEFAQLLDSSALRKKPVRSESETGRRLELTPQAHAEHLAEEIAHWPELNSSNIHNFRIKVKELRYIFELVPDADPQLIGALGRAKGAIGRWHDWQQLASITRDVLDPEQGREMLAKMESASKQKLARALSISNSLRQRLLDSGRLRKAS